MFKALNAWQVNLLEAKCLKQNSQTGERMKEIFEQMSKNGENGLGCWAIP